MFAQAKLLIRMMLGGMTTALVIMMAPIFTGHLDTTRFSKQQLHALRLLQQVYWFWAHIASKGLRGTASHLPSHRHVGSAPAETGAH